MSISSSLLPFQPSRMSTAQLAAVSFLARYSGRTHALYAFQLREWFAWCECNGLDPLVGIQRAHVELYIRGLGERGLRDSSVVTMMHGVRGFFRFAHIDGLIAADPAVYARLPKVHRDESRTQGLDRLELIRFLQVAQTITVHHRRPGLPAGHQRPTRVGSRGGTHRALRRHPARAPGAAPDR
jgi:integrase/recombinase XerD